MAISLYAALIVSTSISTIYFAGSIIVLYAILTFSLKTTILSFARQLDKYTAEKMLLIDFMLDGNRELRLYGISERIIRKFMISIVGETLTKVKQQILALSPRFFFEAFAIIILAVYVMVNNKEDIDLANIATLALGAQRAIPVTQQVAAGIQGMIGAYPSLQIILNGLFSLSCSNNQLKNTPQFPDTSNSTITKKTPIYSVEFDKISFKYENQPYLLNDISLRLNAGQKVALLGKSGSGKSTLIDIACGMLKPTSGRLKFNDHVLTPRNYTSFINSISIVQQKSWFFDGTIKDNLLIGCFEEPSKEFISECLYIACLDQFIDTTRKGLMSSLDDKGASISGGQLQRLALARALARDPYFLILDESTSALDVETQQKVFFRLSKYRPNLLLLSITHRIETLKYFDLAFNVKNRKLSVYH